MKANGVSQKSRKSRHAVWAVSKHDDVLEMDLLVAYGHEGMDTTRRDRQGLERLWLSGTLPWTPS
jgi:hypothetical protein